MWEKGSACHASYTRSAGVALKELNLRNVSTKHAYEPRQTPAKWNSTLQKLFKKKDSII